MAGDGGQRPADLSGSGARLEDLTHGERLRLDPCRYHVFLALRVLDAEAADAPALGRSRRPRQDRVRLGQEPSLAFHPATIAGFRAAANGQPPRLSQFAFGLFGPHGPLPPHLTEYARERQRTHRDRTFAAFADMLIHRSLSLMFRAWTTGEPAASLDKGRDGGIERSVAALAGHLGPAFRDRDAMPDLAKRHFAGHLGRGPKNAAGLAAILSAFFSVPVRVQEFIGSWLTLEPGDRWQLGARAGLGRATSIGSRVASRSAKFRIRVGPMALAEYERMLPGGEALTRLTAIVRTFAGDRLDWDVNLVLSGSEIPAATLSGGWRLGQTTWIGGRRQSGDAADLYLTPMDAPAPGAAVG